jgi:hypothetical protein
MYWRIVRKKLSTQNVELDLRIVITIKVRRVHNRDTSFDKTYDVRTSQPLPRSPHIVNWDTFDQQHRNNDGDDDDSNEIL